MKSYHKHWTLLLPVLLLTITAPWAKAQTHSLSVEDAVKLAYEKNRELQVSSLEAEKAEEQLREVRGLALPTIFASGDYFQYWQKQVSFLPGNFIGQGENQLTAIRVGGSNAFLGSLNFSQPLLQPQISPSIKAASLTREIARKAFTAAKIKVASEVRTAYLQVLIKQEQLKLQQQSVERNQQALKDARSLLAQGLASRVDTMRAYVNIENLRPDLIRLNNEVEIAKTVLKRSIGMDDRQEIALLDSLHIDSLLNLQPQEAAIAEALRNRPDIHQLALTKQINQQQLKIAKAGRLPTISLVGAALLQSQANTFSLGEWAWPMSSYTGLQVQIPIFSGFRNESRSKQAQLSLRQSELELEQLRELIRAEVKVALSKVEEASRRMVVQEQTVQIAEMSFSIIRDRWKHGIASRLDLSDAELSLTQSKSNFLQAVYDYLMANIALERGLGKLPAY